MLANYDPFMCANLQTWFGLDNVRLILNFLTAASGMLSAASWIKAAKSRVLAPDGQDAGVGYGGIPVNVIDSDGKIIDLLKTYPLQSKWNSIAALFSALTAIFSALLFLNTRCG